MMIYCIITCCIILAGAEDDRQDAPRLEPQAALGRERYFRGTFGGPLFRGPPHYKLIFPYLAVSM